MKVCKKILKTSVDKHPVGNIRLVVRSISNANVDLIMNFLLKEMMGKKFQVNQTQCSKQAVDSTRTSRFLIYILYIGKYRQICTYILGTYT